MIDQVLYTNFETDKQYYYFYSRPHEIYLQNNKIFYKYYFGPNGANEIDLTEYIHKYEWNKILIFVDSKEKLLTIYVNFNKAKR